MVIRHAQHAAIDKTLRPDTWPQLQWMASQHGEVLPPLHMMVPPPARSLIIAQQQAFRGSQAGDAVAQGSRAEEQRDGPELRVNADNQAFIDRLERQRETEVEDGKMDQEYRRNSHQHGTVTAPNGYSRYFIPGYRAATPQVFLPPSPFPQYATPDDGSTSPASLASQASPEVDVVPQGVPAHMMGVFEASTQGYMPDHQSATPQTLPPSSPYTQPTVANGSSLSPQIEPGQQSSQCHNPPSISSPALEQQAGTQSMRSPPYASSIQPHTFIVNLAQGQIIRGPVPKQKCYAERIAEDTGNKGDIRIVSQTNVYNFGGPARGNMAPPPRPVSKNRNRDDGVGVSAGGKRKAGVSDHGDDDGDGDGFGDGANKRQRPSNDQSHAFHQQKSTGAEQNDGTQQSTNRKRTVNEEEGEEDAIPPPKRQVIVTPFNVRSFTPSLPSSSTTPEQILARPHEFAKVHGVSPSDVEHGAKVQELTTAWLARRKEAREARCLLDPPAEVVER